MTNNAIYRATKIRCPTGSGFHATDEWALALGCLHWWQRPLWRWLLIAPRGVTVLGWERV